MRFGSFLAASVLLAGASAPAEAGPRVKASPTPKGASFEERLAVAKSVKTINDILGVELGATLQDAHARLDPLNDPARPAKQLKGEEGEVKAVWQLTEGPFASVYVKTDEKRQIEEITGFVRPGEEIPFERIGEVKKAPLLNDSAVVWDVIRPERPAIRVAAQGKERKASLVRLFIVKRRSL
jgi:hypothetical protein